MELNESKSQFEPGDTFEYFFEKDSKVRQCTISHKFSDTSWYCNCLDTESNKIWRAVLDQNLIEWCMKQQSRKIFIFKSEWCNTIVVARNFEEAEKQLQGKKYYGWYWNFVSQVVDLLPGHPWTTPTDQR